MYRSPLEVATGLTIIKEFTYRGDANEEWSNHYWLSGSDPADSAAWRTLFDALVTEEKKLYPPTTKVVAGYGYTSTADDRTAVWSVDLKVAPNTVVAGTYSGFGDVNPGDTAVWVRWGLDRLNSKGKRIFLRKYFHPGLSASAAPDTVHADQIAALTAFGNKLRDGSFTGGRKITDTHGTNVVGSGVSQFITTRTLKRRGKRPPS
jgi:hypothetical protein